jgi:beta-xylosidase
VKRRASGVVAAVVGVTLAGGCASAPAPRASSDGTGANAWVADQGDGTYVNPVILGDYSDPDVIRDGDRYYLVSSSFTSTPALPILRSTDLVNWTIVGHALDNLPDDRYAAFQAGAGVWAPALRGHAGTFYLFVPLPDEGIYVLTAAHPEGPWSAPRLLIAGRGLIDPCPFWDDDGRAYLVHAYARSRAGIKDRLRVRPMAADASRLLGEGEIVFSDPARHPTIEGPKLYKRNGWYYILAPAGGVPHGWQVALRARRIYGPYEDRIVLAQGRTAINGPHQGALVDTPGGQWWFVHFQDAGIYGRVVHLNPVTWTDDWPLMGVAAPDGSREPVQRHAKPALPAAPVTSPQTSDEMDDARDGRLGEQWQWHANHGDDWADLRAHPGWLRLRALPLASQGLGSSPHLLLQKLPARAFSAETAVDPGAAGGAGVTAGLVVAGESTAALAVESIAAVDGGDRAPARRRVVLRVDDRDVFAAPIDAGASVRLRVTMADGGACRFAYAYGADTAANGQMHVIDAVFAARAGRWVGTQIGLFAAGASGGHADFDYLRVSAPAH